MKETFFKSIRTEFVKIRSVVFNGISTLVGYLMPNPVYTNVLNIYNL